MEIILLVTTGIATLLLAYKAYYKKDITLLASVISRLALFIFTLHFVWSGIPLVNSEIKLIWAIIVATIMITDVFVHGYYFLIRKTIMEKDTLRLMDVLGKLQNKYVMMAENAQAGIFVIDSKGHFEYVNPKACDMVGFKKQELLRMSVFDLVIPEKHSFVTEHMINKLRGNSTHSSYDTVLRKSNNELINVHVVSYLTQNGHPTITGNVIICED